MKTTKPTKPTKPTLPRAAALSLATATLAGDLGPLRALAKRKGKKGGWSYHARRLLVWILDPSTPPPFAIFARGNSKLPFSAFSALPFLTCPGKGDCEEDCYSAKAWRFPTALFRQLQNTLMLQTAQGRATIAAAFTRLPIGPVRLYVDGDFPDVATVRFWMALISTRPELPVYGYSKSWLELIGAQLSGITWPENYALNLSSGSTHGPEIRALMAQLPITRGEFLAVQVDRVHIASRAYQGPTRPGWSEYRRAATKAAPPRAFVCRGKCGSCLPSGEHACGAASMRGIPIVIGIH
jgi:hypothetical protein